MCHCFDFFSVLDGALIVCLRLFCVCNMQSGEYVCVRNTLDSLSVEYMLETHLSRVCDVEHSLEQIPHCQFSRYEAALRTICIPM